MNVIRCVCVGVCLMTLRFRCALTGSFITGISAARDGEPVAGIQGAVLARRNEGYLENKATPSRSMALISCSPD